MESKTAEELLQFIGESPSAFHAVDTMKRMLNAEKYEQLLEGMHGNFPPEENIM